MSRTQCGQYPPAAGRVPYCPACTEMTAIPADLPDSEWEIHAEAINARLDRIRKHHVAYRRRRR
jgi:hypothetical protein